jgi:hypothetical protein
MSRFMISLLGMMMTMLSVVLIFVARKPISKISPQVALPAGALQTSMRSPTSKGRSIISNIPAIMFDRVSLAAKPTAMPATPAPAIKGITLTPSMSRARITAVA